MYSQTNTWFCEVTNISAIYNSKHFSNLQSSQHLVRYSCKHLISLQSHLVLCSNDHYISAQSNQHLILSIDSHFINLHSKAFVFKIRFYVVSKSDYFMFCFRIRFHVLFQNRVSCFVSESDSMFSCLFQKSDFMFCFRISFHVCFRIRFNVLFQNQLSYFVSEYLVPMTTLFECGPGQPTCAHKCYEVIQDLFLAWWLTKNTCTPQLRTCESCHAVW